jgi:hypothetical protein
LGRIGAIKHITVAPEYVAANQTLCPDIETARPKADY